jgi:nucleoside-diphosphate-sugar epimerase
VTSRGTARAQRVLIAGRGFIGEHLVGGLEAGGGRVVAAGAHELWSALAELDPEVIVWAAGSRAEDPAVCREQHVTSPVRAFEAAGSLRRFVYLSSGEVYGAQGVPFEESRPLQGTHPYAQAKIAGERALLERAAGRSVALYVLRLPIVYGPRQTGSMLVPALVERLLRGERFAMTRGEQTRDFLYVEDVCALVGRCLSSDAPPGVFNASGGREVPVREAALTIARAVSPEACALLDVGALPYREHEQMRYLLDASRAREGLGWTPRVELATGVARVVEDARRRWVRA